MWSFGGVILTGANVLLATCNFVLHTHLYKWTFPTTCQVSSLVLVSPNVRWAELTAVLTVPALLGMQQ
jgi:hypothetical protein